MVLVNPIDEETVRNFEFNVGAQADGLDRLEPGFECLLAAEAALNRSQNLPPESTRLLLQLRGLRGHVVSDPCLKVSCYFREVGACAGRGPAGRLPRGESRCGKQGWHLLTESLESAM